MITGRINQIAMRTVWSGIACDAPWGKRRRLCQGWLGGPRPPYMHHLSICFSWLCCATTLNVCTRYCFSDFCRTGSHWHVFVFVCCLFAGPRPTARPLWLARCPSVPGVQRRRHSVLSLCAPSAGRGNRLKEAASDHCGARRPLFLAPRAAMRPCSVCMAAAVRRLRSGTARLTKFRHMATLTNSVSLPRSRRRAKESRNLGHAAP